MAQRRFLQWKPAARLPGKRPAFPHAEGGAAGRHAGWRAGGQVGRDRWPPAALPTHLWLHKLALPLSCGKVFEDCWRVRAGPGRAGAREAARWEDIHLSWVRFHVRRRGWAVLRRASGWGRQPRGYAVGPCVVAAWRGPASKALAGAGLPPRPAAHWGAHARLAWEQPSSAQPTVVAAAAAAGRKSCRRPPGRGRPAATAGCARSRARWAAQSCPGTAPG